MVRSRVSGDSSHSPSSSGIYFQGDGTSQALASSSLSPSACNYSSNSVARAGCSNLGSFSGDMNNAAFNSVANSGPSVAASSLVTDENSALSNGPHLQRSASINTESYMHLPASPISFTSNNMSISGSSIMDGPSVARQNSHQEQTAHSLCQNQLQQPRASSSLSLPALENGQLLLPSGSRVTGSYIEDPNNLSQLSKKPRLDIKQEDMIQSQVLQHLLQRQDSMQLQGLTPQFHAFMQPQRMRHQQFLQPIPSMQRVPLKQQQQHPLQWSHHLQQQGLLQVNPMKPPSDGGICARRLMQYLYHQRQRPADNGITYWRKFVAEYYSPRAKKRWCLSLYNNVGQHAVGVFPQAAMDAWQCEICGAKSGRGFEASSEVLPRLNQIKFGSGVVDELLFLDWPTEYRYPSGVMVLEYAKAVQESAYEQLRVVREGKLRIVFAQDLKILSWEFCVRRHEELLPRRLVAPKVNQLVQVAQKCQSTIKESGEDGVSQQDLQTNSNMVLTAGRQLAKSLDLQSLNELGFSKRYVRCLQISEVVNSMKDLVDFCLKNKMGPVEGLKSYNRHMVATKLPSQKMEEIEQPANIQGLPMDRNTHEKSLALHPGLNNQVSSDQSVGNRGALSGSAQAALALTNVQGMIMRQNSMNSSHNSLQQDASSFNRATPSMATPVQGAVTSAPGSLQRLPSTTNSGATVSRKPAAGRAQHLQRRHPLRSKSSVVPQGNPQSSQGDNSQSLQDQMVQQFLLQEMSSGSGGMQGQPLVARNKAGTGGNAAPAQATPRVVAGRSKNFRDAANGGPDVPNGRAPEVSGGNGIDEFLDDSFFDGDLDERTLGFLWKN